MYTAIRQTLLSYGNLTVFGRLFVKRFALCYRTIVCPVLSVTLVYCGQTVDRIKIKRSMQVSLGPGHTVLYGDPGAPSPKGHSPAKFSAHICCVQMARWMKMPLGMEVGLNPSDIVLDWDRAPPPQKGAEPPPQFSAHVYCGQTAAWIKMPLGMDVGLGPCHIVLDGDQLPSPKKGAQPPIFGPCLLWLNGWIDQNTT